MSSIRESYLIGDARAARPQGCRGSTGTSACGNQTAGRRAAGTTDLIFERVERPKVPFNEVLDQPRGGIVLALGVGFEAAPIEVVVPDLRRLVKDHPCGLHDKFVQRLVLPLGILRQFQKVIQIVDIGQMVFTVMILQRLCADVGRQRLLVPSQWR